MKPKVKLLETTDIFDLYGCEFVFSKPTVNTEDKSIVEQRVNEIYNKYLFAARERIKSECRFLGISEDDFDGMSFAQMVTKLSGMLEKEIENQADNLLRGGNLNIMKTLINAQKMAGADMSAINMAAYGVEIDEKPEEKANSINADSLLKDPKWHVIAQAFIDLENANTTQKKILAIDYLNDLQHNSFHLLIDLQTGRMLEGKSDGVGYGKHSEAVNIVKEVLDIKHDASSPIEYTSKMSKDIAKLVGQYNRMG